MRVLTGLPSVTPDGGRPTSSLKKMGKNLREWEEAREGRICHAKRNSPMPLL